MRSQAAIAAVINGVREAKRLGVFSFEVSELQFLISINTEGLASFFVCSLSCQEHEFLKELDSALSEVPVVRVCRKSAIMQVQSAVDAHASSLRIKRKLLN